MSSALTFLGQGRGTALAACHMLMLANTELRVELLDPAKEQSRLGPRFCWGGYVWQVNDARAGALLSGPEWPEPDPQAWNGQGLPESFRHNTTNGEPLLWDGDIGLAPGAGALGRDANGAVVVTSPCNWEVEVEDERARFHTEQSVGKWSYALDRTIELHGRKVLSISRLENRGTATLKLEWFAHPFFALQGDRTFAATLPNGSRLAGAGSFVMDGRTLGPLHVFKGRDDGSLDQLSLADSSTLIAQLSHPKVGWVRFETSFAPSKCVVWANGNTFSIEPFQKLDLAPRAATEWTLTYEFGPSQ